jgi:hypothetical protein
MTAEAENASFNALVPIWYLPGAIGVNVMNAIKSSGLTATRRRVTPAPPRVASADATPFSFNILTPPRAQAKF